MDVTTLISTFIYFSFLLILSYILKSWLQLLKYRTAPGPKPILPIIGTNWFFFTKNVPQKELFSTVMKELPQTYGEKGYCVMFNANHIVVLMFDPKYGVEFIKDNKVMNKADDYNSLKMWLGNGLVTSNGNIWKNKRKRLNPTFHSNVLDNYIPSMNFQCETLLKKLNEAANANFIDIRSLMSETTLNIIAMTAMGITLEEESKEINDYRECMHTLATNLLSRVHNPLNWYDFIFFRREIGKKLLRDIELVQKFHRKVLEMRRTEFTPGYQQKTKHMAFLDMLLTLQSEDKQITDDEILDDVSTFMFAGHDTSSVCLTFTLYLLGKHENVQQKLIEEMNSIFGDDKQRDVNKEDINQMHYTECVIKESLRLFPPVPEVGRKASEDFSIDSHHFPKGTSVFIFIKDIQKNEKLFPNPLEFIPERFDNATDVQSSFIPFALGPRNCIGQRFAMIEMKVILAHIFRKFSIKTMNKDGEIKVSMDVTQRPIEPINIQFKQLKF